MADPDHGAKPLLLHGGVVVEPGSVPREADLLVVGGRIDRLANAGDHPEPTRLDCRGCLVMPGLTNAHTHSPENLAAGFCDGLRLESWLDAVWGRLDHLAPDEVTRAVVLGAGEMLRSGVTAVVDHFRQTPMRLEAIDAAIRAYRRTGLRVLFAPMGRDRGNGRGGLVGAPTGGAPLSPSATRDLWREIATRNAPEDRVQIGIGPSGPTRCTDEMFGSAVEIAREHGLFLHTHVAETRVEAQTGAELYGRPMVEHLDRLGFLGPKTSLAHCIWIEPSEIERIAASGTCVAHNPVSNMAIGSGIAPVAELLAAGATVAIGTDGAASNGGQDLLESMKSAALLPRCQVADPSRWISAETAFHMTSAGGRTLFGLGSARLDEGSIADIAVFPAPARLLDEYADAIRQFVYRPSSGARHVIVAGNVVLHEGRPCGFDPAEF